MWFPVVMSRTRVSDLVHGMVMHGTETLVLYQLVLDWFAPCLLVLYIIVYFSVLCRLSGDKFEAIILSNAKYHQFGVSKIICTSLFLFCCLLVRRKRGEHELLVQIKVEEGYVNLAWEVCEVFEYINFISALASYYFFFFFL